MALKRLHLLTGIAALVAFLSTGLIMRAQLRLDPSVEPAVRFMRRADHLYILLSALLNLALGAYWRPVPARSRFQSIGSIAVLASPLLFLIAFFAEPAPNRFVRPFTGLGAVVALTGVLLHVLSARRLNSSDQR